MKTVTVREDHYATLLVMAGQDLAEASATELGATGALVSPGLSFTHVLVDAFAVSPQLAAGFVTSYVDSLESLCHERSLAAPAVEEVLAASLAEHDPGTHAPADLSRIVRETRGALSEQSSRRTF